MMSVLMLSGSRSFLAFIANWIKACVYLCVVIDSEVIPHLSEP